MAHLGRGDQGEDPLYHPQPRPEDGDDGQLFAGQLLGDRLGHGGLDFYVLEGKVSGGLIAHEGGHFVDDLAEIFHASGLVPKDGELVLQEGVIQYVYHFVHCSMSPFLCHWFCGAGAAFSRARRSRSAWERRW